MHAPVEWKLYDMCGVHQVTFKDKEIFMHVEKDYPLRKGLALVMICYKLQVENYSHMANDLILKIYKIANCPSQQVIEFSLAEKVSTASEESCHCQMKREATAVKIALLSKSRRNCQSKSDDSYAKLGDFKFFDTLADLGSCVNLMPLYLFKKLKIILLKETDNVFGLADGTKSYPVGIVKNVEVHIGKLKLLEDFYVIDMKKDPATSLLGGRGFLATVNAVIDCKKAKIAVGEGITRNNVGVEGADKEEIDWNRKLREGDVADNRTMEELLQAPTEGYGEAIVITEINADHFEIKTNLLQLVQANTYHGLERDNPHTHINNFKRITSTLKFRDVPNDVIKLMMFPYSLKGSDRVWYDKKPANTILTWEDLVNKFMNQFYPSSKTTHLKNEISRFTQRSDETFGEAWERFKEMLRACPHHGFTELTQIDTLYNGLNENDQDSLNAATGRNLLSKTNREALHIIENKLKVHYSRNKPNVFRINTTSRENANKVDDRIDKLADQISPLVNIFAKKVVTLATVKAVEESCITCGGNHAYYNCDATNSNQSNVCATTGFQNQPFQVPNNQVQQGFSNEFSSYKKANDQMMRNMQNQINSLKGEFKNQIQNTMKTQQTILMEQQNALQNNLQNMLCGFFQNQTSTSGTLLSNTILNPKGEMKAITTHSGIAYEGPSIPTKPSPKKAVERETEETTDKEQTNF
nr:hypothetical protein [Tanacetum cinerariifolium]